MGDQVLTAIAAAGDVLADEHADSLPLVEQERLAARRLARTLVARHLGLEAADVSITQTCASCGGPHGRPQVVGHDVHVGWAHSAGLVAVVVHDRPCAIDIESLAGIGPPPRGTLTAAERTWLDRQPDPARGFAELWVRKEVLVKLGLVSLDEVFAVDVTPSFEGVPVLGTYLVGVDAGRHDAVVARSSSRR